MGYLRASLGIPPSLLYSSLAQASVWRALKGYGHPLGRFVPSSPWSLRRCLFV